MSFALWRIQRKNAYDLQLYFSCCCRLQPGHSSRLTGSGDKNRDGRKPKWQGTGSHLHNTLLFLKSQRWHYVLESSVLWIIMLHTSSRECLYFYLPRNEDKDHCINQFNTIIQKTLRSFTCYWNLQLQIMLFQDRQSKVD